MAEAAERNQQLPSCPWITSMGLIPVLPNREWGGEVNVSLARFQVAYLFS